MLLTKAIAGVLVAFTAVQKAAADCPNGCSGHGLCGTPDRVCRCSVGFIGGDCSLRACPEGLAWHDQAVAFDDAHNFAECSNMGLCDRLSGICVCNPGYEGLACQRLTCPNSCSGHGSCRSIKYHATQRDPGDYAGLDEGGQLFPYTENWDSDKIYGCQCDPGYDGFDCSLRLCPKGDDPLTGKAETVADSSEIQVNDKQKIYCLASGGHFTLTFMQQTTEHINYDDSLDDLTRKINALPTISSAAVSFENSATTEACTRLGNAISIEFTQDFGDIPYIVVDGSALTNQPGSPELENKADDRVFGNKENIFCSGRGACDQSIGVCTCYEPFATSDGEGNDGTRGDCGTSGTSSISACPGDIACSRHGVCQGPNTYACVCANGWYGGDCSERTCPLGKGWFGHPHEEAHQAHARVECSNMGTCDRSKGECQCHLGFDGGACQTMMCPGSPVCSGHGECQDMSVLAELAQVNGDNAGVTYGTIPNNKATWDYNMVKGCLCDQGWEGYDCTLRSCPTGDDPNTTNQYKEVQLLYCTATEGEFSLTFREAQTEAIPFDATAAELQEILEKLQTIGQVEVRYSAYSVSGDEADNVACTSEGGSHIAIEFVTELGNVPDLQHIAQGSDMTIRLMSDGQGSSQMGTMENVECSNRGLCDYGTGECRCFLGHGSSDGSGNAGNRGDCGYIEPIYAGSASESANNG